MYSTTSLSAFAALTIAVTTALTSRAANPPNITLPPGAVYVNPLNYSVLGANYSSWRNNSFVGFNPTNSTPPAIQFYDPSFLNVTGPNATIRLVASNPGFAFAHEAPIYVPGLNSVFFSSFDGGPYGYSGWNNNSVVSILNMTQVNNALASSSGGGVNVQVQTLNLSNTIQMVNGGTGPYYGNLLFVTSGRALSPPSVALVNPNPPYNSTILLDNFYGRQFNSLNDIKVLPGTNLMYFTDATYGWMAGFRPEAMMPSQVYRFDPSTGQIQIVADQFDHPNGIAFSPDGRTAFVTDSGADGANWGNNQTSPATIYRYDVDQTTKAFTGRSVFAYTDAGVPDGIQLDASGNVYAGCADGAQVWNPNGTLIGKFFLNATTPEMVFTNSGLLMLAQERVYLANVQAQGNNLTVT